MGKYLELSTTRIFSPGVVHFYSVRHHNALKINAL
jgi:hypothetical protein